MIYRFGPCFRVSGLRPRDYTLKILFSKLTDSFFASLSCLNRLRVCVRNHTDTSFEPTSADVEIFQSLKSGSLRFSTHPPH